MKAFGYPKEIHRRGANPGPFTDYRTYKPYLRDEFEGTCIYCRLRDSIVGQASFAVEHHMPQSPFTNRITDWTNLYYACRTCNGAKSNFYPRGTRSRIDYLPTPCTDRMFDHLRYRRALVVPHSETGRFAEELLDLNESTSVEYREFFQKILDEAEDKVALWEKTEGDIRRMLATASGSRVQKLTNGLDRASKELAQAKAHLAFIVGPY